MTPTAAWREGKGRTAGEGGATTAAAAAAAAGGRGGAAATATIVPPAPPLLGLLLPRPPEWLPPAPPALPQRSGPWQKTKTSKIFLVLVLLLLLVPFFHNCLQNPYDSSLCGKRQPSSQRACSLPRSLRPLRYKTNDRSRRQHHRCKPSVPWFLTKMRCNCSLRTTQRKGTWNQKIPNSSNRLVHSKKEATELICPRYLLTERWRRSVSFGASSTARWKNIHSHLPPPSSPHTPTRPPPPPKPPPQSAPFLPFFWLKLDYLRMISPKNQWNLGHTTYVPIL
jgi:hypothetical protein